MEHFLAHAWLGAHRGQGWGRGRGGDGFTSSRDLRCLPQSVSRDEGGWVASPKGQWVWVMGAVSLGPPTPSVLEADVHRATPSSPLHTTDTAVTGLTESRVFNQKGGDGRGRTLYQWDVGACGGLGTERHHSQEETSCS